MKRLRNGDMGIRSTRVMMHLRKDKGWGEPFSLPGECHHFTHEVNAFRRHCDCHMNAEESMDVEPHVLNVFRRHCGYHRLRVARGFVIAGAQRLSASLRLSPRSGKDRRCCSLRAQRLSASLRLSHCGLWLPWP